MCSTFPVIKKMQILIKERSMRFQGNGDSHLYYHLKNNWQNFQKCKVSIFVNPTVLLYLQIYLSREMIKYIDIREYQFIAVFFFAITIPQKQTKSPSMEPWLTKRSSYTKYGISTAVDSLQPLKRKITWADIVKNIFKIYC